MKKGNPILVLSLVIIAVILYFFMSQKEVKKVAQDKKKSVEYRTEKSDEVSFITIENSFQDIVLEGDGYICLKKTFPIISPKKGVIDSLNFLVGSLKRKGELLFIYENTELFQKMSQRKKTLKQLVENSLKEINWSNGEQNEWNNFLITLSPENILPEFPSIQDKQLREVFKKNNVFKSYNQLVDDEEMMNSFFVITEKAGRISEILVQRGGKINKGDTVAILEENIPDLVKITINEKDIKKIKTADKILFYNENNNLIGKGKFYYSKNENKKEVVYLSIKPFENQRIDYGEGVRYKSAKIGMEKCTKVPNKFIKSDSILYVNSKLVNVKVVSKTEDFSFVIGLTDGDTIYLHQK